MPAGQREEGQVDRSPATLAAAEAALRESQSMLHGIFRAAPIGIGVVSRRVLQWTNQRLCEMTGYTAEELAGQSARILYPSDEDFEFVGREKYRQIADHGTGTVETRWVRKDGRGLDILLSSTPVDPADLDAGVVFTALDVTERKVAEAALRESEARYRTLFETMAQGVVYQDASGRIVSANPAAERILGLSPEQMRGRTSVHPEWKAIREDGSDFPGDEHPAMVALRTGRVVRDVLMGVHNPVSGERVWILVNAVPGFVPGGSAPDHVYATFSDVTELRRTEAARIELERRLLHAQKLESLGVLAGGIAHDFNNLLMAILGNLDVALQDTPAGARSREGIERAVQAGRRATELTRQMLAYSGRGRFVISRLDLGQLVRENANLFRTVIPRTATMTLHLASEPAMVEADAGQVQQVVMNLITNAAEAIGDGPGEITLTTGTQTCDERFLERTRLDSKPPPGRYVFLEVSDTGCGMDEDALQRLFEPFFTTKFTGRGLGMPVVLGIVRGHGGAILVESAPGRGTTIRVLFAAAAEPAAPAQRPAPEDAARPVVAGVAGGTVLVVDDEEAVRGLCASFLRRLGFSVLTAADGREAVSLFERNADALCCVLLDLTMPRLDGLGAFREMHRLRPDVPVILASGYDEQDARQRSPLGLAGFLHKPYQLRDLQVVLDRVRRRPDGGS